MFISLLCGANPKLCQIGPIVRLERGRWRFETNLVDSRLLANFLSPSTLPEFEVVDTGIFELLESCHVQLKFIERGKENFLNVRAEKL